MLIAEAFLNMNGIHQVLKNALAILVKNKQINSWAFVHLSFLK